MPSASTSGEAGAGRVRPVEGWRGSALRALLACALIALLMWAWGRAVPDGLALHGQPLDGHPAPAFRGLHDTRGRDFDWSASRGDAVLVFFGYTHCPDVCPLTLVRLARVLDGLGAGARRVRVVFVTLDPARDSPKVLEAYLGALLPAATGLRGDASATARSASQWGVRWRRVTVPGGGADYWFDHTASVTLVGPRGHLRARYGYAQLASPGLLRGDLQALLR